MNKLLFPVLLAAFFFIVNIPITALGGEKYDYPTEVRADYVFACMASNGQSYDVLQKCSCSIDYIATRLTYAEYEQAATIMSLQEDVGQRGVFYREAKWAMDRLDRLKKIRAESTVACFK